MDCLIRAYLFSNDVVGGVYTTVNVDDDLGIGPLGTGGVLGAINTRNLLWRGFFIDAIMNTCPGRISDDVVEEIVLGTYRSTRVTNVATGTEFEVLQAGAAPLLASPRSVRILVCVPG
ncbi:MAG: hypothetical protein M5U28_51445 [Sandaracinaceae bacterium]|nr:hypothetical protein [Sandaracinaceae bacterium]